MSPRWSGASLLEPITAEEPCGKSLEDSDSLSLLDAYQVFGQDSLEPDPADGGKKQQRREPRKSDRPPNWVEIRDLSLDLLAKSKDLRLLAHLGTALLRTDGPLAFIGTLSVASGWLNTYWSKAYPLVEDDAVFRRNALNYFADPVAVIDGLRRAPLVSSRQHGRVSLRDLEVVAGAVAATADDRPDEARISAAFAEMPFAELQELQAGAGEALTAAGAIDEVMRRESGIEAAPSFEPLVAQLKNMVVALQARLAAHPANTQSAEGGATGEGSVVSVGAIRSRQDAIRALDAAAEFFRRNEPSSPVPMLVDRAKRLVSKDFLEVLADVAPEALPQARAAGGIRD